ncbi:MAG: hypothetical protein PVI06_12980, partial [Desulfobacterales bacterium]
HEVREGGKFLSTQICPLPDLLFSALFERSGYFFHDKLIAPALLRGRGRLPPRKATHGVGSCWSERFKQPAVKCEAVAAVRLGRQQPGILP